MSSGTDTEPRWLSNLGKLFEFSFKLSFILVAILSSYIIWMLLFGWALLPDEGPDLNMEWCEEYHPKLTYSECSDVAGW